MLQLLLIRHGEPAYPADALTPRGERQAERLGRRLREADLVELWTSPMGRARQTAKIVSRAVGLPVREAPWLAELESWAIDDPVRGEAPAWEIDAGSVRTANAAALTAEGWSELGALATAPGLADDFAALGRSADAFLAEYGYLRTGESYAVAPDAFGGALAVVCHCGLALTWLAHLLAVPPPVIWSGFTLPPASITRICFDSRSGLPRCHGFGDVGHLVDVAVEATL